MLLNSVLKRDIFSLFVFKEQSNFNFSRGVDMFRELKWSCNRKKEKRKKPERKWHTVDIQFCKTMQRQTGGVH